MWTIKDLREVKAHEAVFIIVPFFFILSPALLVMWYYAPDLIKEVSTPKLILLSATAIAPLLIFNMMNAEWLLGDSFFSEAETYGQRILLEFYVGMIASGLGVLVVLIIARIHNWNLNEFLNVVSTLQLCVSLVCGGVGLIRFVLNRRRASLKR